MNRKERTQNTTLKAAVVGMCRGGLNYQDLRSKNQNNIVHPFSSFMYQN